MRVRIVTSRCPSAAGLLSGVPGMQLDWEYDILLYILYTAVTTGYETTTQSINQAINRYLRRPSPPI